MSTRTLVRVGVASAFPLVLAWLALDLTHALPGGALDAIAVAIMAYAAFIGFRVARATGR